MTPIFITADSVLLRLSDGEAPAPWPALLHRALRSAGEPPWPFAEAELYTAGGESLLLARRQKRFYIALPDFETLLRLLPLCRSEAALYARPEDYLLALDSRGAGLWPWEWGHPRPLRPETEARWQEQGLCLHRDARELLPLFSRPSPTE